MRLWKRKWFVLSDYCLFYYKGESCASTPQRGYALLKLAVLLCNCISYLHKRLVIPLMLMETHWRC